MSLVSVEVDLTVSPPDKNTTDILIEKKKKALRRIQLRYTWSPDPQKLWDNKCVLIWGARFAITYYAA